MNWMEAAQTYTLLTIGDGLVSTIPSLIISTSAGIIVSRAAAEAQLGEEFLGQLTMHPRALKLVSGILLLFGLVPGMPTFAFLLLASVLFMLSTIANKQKSLLESQGKKKSKSQATSLDTPEEVSALLPLDTLALEVGYGLIPLVDEEQNGNLLTRIRALRRQFALDMGVVIPSMHLKDNLELKPGEYRVLLKGNEIGRGEILIDHYLAIDPGDIKHRIKGIETVEPAFKMPALWIPKNRKEEALLAGYTVVDPATVITTHLTQLFKRHLHEFLGRQEVQNLLDTLAQRAPKAVEDLIPNILSLGVVQKVLQNLVKEGVSIRDMLTIVETLADYGQQTKDPVQLTEYVRQHMARNIVSPYLAKDNTLPIILLDQEIESLFQENIKQTDTGAFLTMDPHLAHQIIQKMIKTLEKVIVKDGQPVLLVSPPLRPHLAQICVRFIPNLPVISQAEIPPEIQLETIAQVRLDHAS